MVIKAQKHYVSIHKHVRRGGAGSLRMCNKSEQGEGGGLMRGERLHYDVYYTIIESGIRK